MGWFGDIFTGWSRKGSTAEDYFYSRFGGKAIYNTLKNQKEKLDAVLTSPAALSVFSLQCSLFSLAKVTYVDSDGIEMPNSEEVLARLRSPNPFQGQRQFLYDYMFWSMINTAYLYTTSKVLTPDTYIYWLDTTKMYFPHSTLMAGDKLYSSKTGVKEYKKKLIEYRYSDGAVTHLKLSDISAFTTISNGMGNWYGAPSPIDAIYKIIGNSEKALDAKHINLDFAGKYIVSGNVKADDMYNKSLSEGEQKSTEDMVNGDKAVHALKTPISISRFVDDIAKLGLDTSYSQDYYTIGKMYQIPKEVLQADMEKDSTFNNQATARASHVEYSLMPRADDLADGLKSHFNLEGYLVFSWEHLNFTQETKKQRLENVNLLSKAINGLRKAGVSTESISELLEIEINFDEKRYNTEPGDNAKPEPSGPEGEEGSEGQA